MHTVLMMCWASMVALLAEGVDRNLSMTPKNDPEL